MSDRAMLSRAVGISYLDINGNCMTTSLKVNNTLVPFYLVFTSVIGVV